MVDTIICGDCLDVMPTIEDKSINLCILDLPYGSYNTKFSVGDKQQISKKGMWDSIPEYITFVADVFKECERVLKDNGSLYWFHNDFNTIVDVYTRLRDNSRFVFRQFIVWNKKFKGAPNEAYLQWWNEIHLRNYQRHAEYILYFVRRESTKIEWDKTGLERVKGCEDSFLAIKDYLRQEKTKTGLSPTKINQLLDSGAVAQHYFGDKGMWRFPTRERYLALQTTGCFQRDYEDLRREYDGLRLEYEDMRREYEDLRYTFNNQKTHHSVWNYPVAPKNGHITPKPVELIENIIEYSSNEGDTVLDPTAGSGTTAVACKRSDRHYICIEKEPEYCAIAEKRIAEML